METLNKEWGLAESEECRECYDIQVKATSYIVAQCMSFSEASHICKLHNEALKHEAERDS